MSRDKLRDRFGDFFTDALSPPRAVDLKPLSSENRAGRRADNQLQLCSADFDADEALPPHRLGSQNGRSN
jgi:hypothetical protein